MLLGPIKSPAETRGILCSSSGPGSERTSRAHVTGPMGSGMFASGQQWRSSLFCVLSAERVRNANLTRAEEWREREREREKKGEPTKGKKRRRERERKRAGKQRDREYK